MSSHPSVSVVIPAADAAGTLPAALHAVESQDYPGEIEVLVAAADPATAAVARDLGVTVIDNAQGRTPVGLNLAARASSGDVLVRVDAHSIIPSNYISRAVATLTRTNATNVGGRQVPHGTTFSEKAIARAMSSRFGAGDARYRIGGQAGPTDTVYLGTFRRSVFEDLEGYDERYVRHQDYELNHRIRSNGGTIWFDPDLAVTYRPRPSLASLAGQYFQYGRWKRFFARSNPGSLRARQWAPPLLVLALLASVVASIWWAWMLVVPAAYLLALVAIGLLSVLAIGAPGLLVPAALAVMHVSWGTGFLVGQTSAR